MSKAIRMLENIAGGWHEDDAWHEYPAKGETGVFADQQADDLVTGGYAEYVKEEKRAAPETATAPPAKAETRQDAAPESRTGAAKK